MEDQVFMLKVDDIFVLHVKDKKVGDTVEILDSVGTPYKVALTASVGNDKYTFKWTEIPDQFDGKFIKLNGEYVVETVEAHEEGAVIRVKTSKGLKDQRLGKMVEGSGGKQFFPPSHFKSNPHWQEGDDKKRKWCIRTYHKAAPGEEVKVYKQNSDKPQTIKLGEAITENLWLPEK